MQRLPKTRLRPAPRRPRRAPEGSGTPPAQPPHRSRARTPRCLRLPCLRLPPRRPAPQPAPPRRPMQLRPAGKPSDASAFSSENPPLPLAPMRTPPQASTRGRHGRHAGNQGSPRAHVQPAPAIARFFEMPWQPPVSASLASMIATPSSGKLGGFQAPSTMVRAVFLGRERRAPTTLSAHRHRECSAFATELREARRAFAAGFRDPAAMRAGRMRRIAARCRSPISQTAGSLPAPSRRIAGKSDGSMFAGIAGGRSTSHRQTAGSGPQGSRRFFDVRSNQNRKPPALEAHPQMARHCHAEIPSRAEFGESPARAWQHSVDSSLRNRGKRNVGAKQGSKGKVRECRGKGPASPPAKNARGGKGRLRAC